ncbi:hypothetical protein [Bradyrhizobium sp.]|uniref:hypothetical protein n=1 Tax=Bradyrhizobium sp. TaxID=376 RepID=UPI0039E38D0D
MSKVCPECQHVFQGNGWDGIDAHWRAKHDHIMPYEEAWPLIRAETYAGRSASNGRWYLELFDKGASKAKRVWTEPTWSAVIPHVRSIKQSTTEKLRIMAPAAATDQELFELEQFGVERRFP